MDLTQLHLHWRVSQYKGKRYRSYSLARAYREQGKNRKEIVLKLGKLTDSQAQQWRQLLQAVKQPGAFLTTLDDLVVIEHYAYLDVATAHAIWDDWQLDQVFSTRGHRELGVETVACVLSVNRCIDPTSKSQVPAWFRRTALPWLLNIDPERVNASRIFRELTVIEQHKEALCRHLYEQIRCRYPNTLDSVFYDLSSTTFTGSRCVLMKWGHCKEGYHNHVVLALVVNRQGLPFYWEVLPGGTADVTTLKGLMENLSHRFDLRQTTLVFDRGMVSDENLTQLEAHPIKYISALDRHQLEGVTGVDFMKFAHFDPEQVSEQIRQFPEFVCLNDTTYAWECSVAEPRRYILCFNPQLFRDQRQAQARTLAEFGGFVEQMNTELRQAKRSRQRQASYDKFTRRLKKLKLHRFVDIALDEIQLLPNTERDPIRTYQARVIIDPSAQHQTEKLHGFWLLVTNHIETTGLGYQLTTEQAVEPYREKVVIESAFRDIKSFVEIKPVHVWTSAHVKAHYTCCVLAHLINRTLSLRLHLNLGSVSEDVISHERLYQELSDCQIDHIEVQNLSLSTYRRTRESPRQKELLERLGLQQLLAFEGTSSMN